MLLWIFKTYAKYNILHITIYVYTKVTVAFAIESPKRLLGINVIEKSKCKSKRRYCKIFRNWLLEFLPSARYISPSVRYISPNVRYISPSVRYMSPNVRYISRRVQYIYIKCVIFKCYSSE